MGQFQFHPSLYSCHVAWFLTGHRLVLVLGPGVEDPCVKPLMSTTDSRLFLFSLEAGQAQALQVHREQTNNVIPTSEVTDTCLWKSYLKELLFKCSVVSDSFETSWTVAQQAPLSVGFPRQEYWSGLPFPSPRDFRDPGMELGSPVSPLPPALAGGFFTTEPSGKLHLKEEVDDFV